MSVSLYLRNEAGRAGIPLKRSWQRWIDAIPDLHGRRKAEINLVVVGTRQARRYNREFRGKDYATNVLSFPYQPLPGEQSHLQSARLLGDLIICAPVVAREAAAQGKPLRHHYAHLTLHGVLHLLGYDHQNPADAAKMEALEVRLLAELGIPDPYA